MKHDKDIDLSGKKVGEYDVLAQIGVGGMGVVYSGLQPMIGKKVAIKVLLPHLSNEPELVGRFLSEARAVNAIGHRGIVDIFSFGEIPGGSHYFVMEFLDGTSFDRLIKDRGALPPYDVLMWISEVLDALSSAHSVGIIHRDIKPSNLFLVHGNRSNAYVKLLDFGIAKLGSALGESTPQTRASMLIGTPDYMAPEQARGQPIGPFTDLYALGCVMFEMLTGERLFKGENPMQTMFMHVENTPRRLSEVAPGVPRELDDLVAWTLEKQPAARPQTAEALRNRVEELLDLIPRNAAPAATVGRGAPGRRTPAPISSGIRSRRPRAATPPPPQTRTAFEPPEPAATLSESATPTFAPSELTQVRVAPTVGQPRAAPPPQPDLPPPQPSRFGAIGVLFGFVAVAGLTLGWFLTRTSPTQVTPVTVEELNTVEAPIEPPPMRIVEPQPIEKPQPIENPQPVEKLPVVAKPTDEVRPVGAKPKRRVPTEAELQDKLAKLEAVLTAREAKSGLRDGVLHQFLEQGRAVVKQATTEPGRQKAARFLGDFEQQLGPAR